MRCRFCRRYWQQMALGMSIWASAVGQSPGPVVSPDRGDRRFRADSGGNAWYSALKQAYL